MVFDTRGRRRNVIRVVYAVLALLMGASLFVAVGPFNLAELIGTGGSGSADEVLDEQAQRIEGRLAKDPTNEQLLLALTRTRIATGNAQVEVDPETQVPTIPQEARTNFETASGAWDRYLKEVGDEPNASAAQLVAGTYFRLAESGGSTYGEVLSNVKSAAAAQRIAAAQRPSVGSLSTLAIYEFFGGEFAAGDAATKQSVELAPSKAEGKSIEKQLDEYRKNAKRFTKEAQRASKVEAKAGKEQLQSPLGGLGLGGSIGE